MSEVPKISGFLGFRGVNESMKPFAKEMIDALEAVRDTIVPGLG